MNQQGPSVGQTGWSPSPPANHLADGPPSDGCQNSRKPPRQKAGSIDRLNWNPKRPESRHHEWPPSVGHLRRPQDKPQVRERHTGQTCWIPKQPPHQRCRWPSCARLRQKSSMPGGSQGEPIDQIGWTPIPPLDHHQARPTHATTRGHFPNILDVREIGLPITIDPPRRRDHRPSSTRP